MIMPVNRATPAPLDVAAQQHCVQTPLSPVNSWCTHGGPASKTVFLSSLFGHKEAVLRMVKMARFSFAPRLALALLATVGLLVPATLGQTCSVTAGGKTIDLTHISEEGYSLVDVVARLLTSS